MAIVSTLDEMRANRVGFGSFIKRDAEPFRIRSLSDVLDFDANKKAKKDASGNFVIKEFTIPLESEEKVVGQISKPSLGGKRSDDATKYHSSALVHILETLQNNNKAILTSGRDASHGIINDLLQGGESTENYKEFDAFFDKPRAGQPISGGEGRSVAKLLPSAVIGEGSLKKEDSLTKQQKNRLKERFKQLGKTTPLSLENDVVGADGKKRKPIMKVNSVYGLLLAVQSGVGLAALPDYIVYNIPNLTKVLPSESGKPTETHFVYPASLKNVARLTAFRNFIFSKVNEWKF